MAKTKGGWGASRANLMARIIAERLTGEPQETYVNAAMAHGTETEPMARSAYAFMYDVDVAEVGLIRHPTIAGAHASPDGLVNADGMVEIKCPNTATHIETLLSGEIADRYVKQMQFQMSCAGREWCDFASFDPRMPGDLQLFVRRVPRDPALIAEIEEAVQFFIIEADAKQRKLMALRVAA
jgi:putative phage-type endonuclease